MASREVGAIDGGLCVLVGAGEGDGPGDVAYIADKVVGLRVFPDEAGRMNRSVLDTGGGVLAVSQFTLYGDARKGRRPSFVTALAPEAAEPLYESLLSRLRDRGVARVAGGEFGANMAVDLVNDGPVTLLLDSQKQF